MKINGNVEKTKHPYPIIQCTNFEAQFSVGVELHHSNKRFKVRGKR